MSRYFLPELLSFHLFFAALFFCGSASAQNSTIDKNITVDRVLVFKKEHRLYLMSGAKVLKGYHIALGKSPVGRKVRQGDRRTPEGNYTLDYKKADSSYYRAIHISYPNEADKARAKKLGVNPGGAIMLHGQPNGWGWLSFIRQRFNWTSGCIAVPNRDMDQIWKMVKTGTPIEIRKDGDPFLEKKKPGTTEKNRSKKAR